MNIDLNLPIFMEGRQQLLFKEIEERRRIAFLRIHAERAIGQIKTLGLCKGTIPISMARLANQIVCVCAFLSNFQPALVPPATQNYTEDVYIKQLCLSDCDDKF